MPSIVERGRGHVLKYFIQAVKPSFCKKQNSAIFIFEQFMQIFKRFKNVRSMYSSFLVTRLVNQ